MQFKLRARLDPGVVRLGELLVPEDLLDRHETVVGNRPGTPVTRSRVGR